MGCKKRTADVVKGFWVGVGLGLVVISFVPSCWRRSRSDFFARLSMVNKPRAKGVRCDGNEMRDKRRYRYGWRTAIMYEAVDSLA